MNQNYDLISFGNYSFKINHLLIIGILALSFSISFMIRSLPADYGWELNEFDPFFNYRATEYILENGIEKYFEWNDELSWYPYGRDVSENSQVFLHIFTAFTYWIFGGSSDLYDYVILFPIVIGSLTCIIIFALVRTLGGTASGLVASLLFSISLPIILRGQMGWFKSEPLGLFLGFLSSYLFLSALNSNQNIKSAIKFVLSGLVLSFGLSAWGGAQFFLLPIGITIFSITFFKTEKKFVFLISIFLSSFILSVFLFERPGISLLSGLNGISLILPTIFLICTTLIQKKFNIKSRIKFNSIFLLVMMISLIFFIFVASDSNTLKLPTHRYLNAVNPLITTSNPLTESVSEHATATLKESFFFHSSLLLFSGIGIWLILSKKFKTNKNEFIVFILATGFIGTYIASTFMRLEVFAAYSLILLSSIGISTYFRNILRNSFKSNSKFISNRYVVLGIIVGILIFTTYFPQPNLFTSVDNPATIFTGGSSIKYPHSDWLLALEWIKQNTPNNSVIASWWDYGYWIQTLAERTSISDNSTVNDKVIENLGAIFYQEPDDAWESLQNMEVDYFVLFLRGERYIVDDPSGKSLYALYGGGDESKKYWFGKIGGVNIENYLYPDLVSGNEQFWEKTFLGKITPFKPIGYANFETQQMSKSYQDGWLGIYEKNTDFIISDNSPFKLVYSSPSFEAKKGELLVLVLVYEINDDYKKNLSDTS